MAPEQWGRGKITFSADIFALGVLLFQCFTGQLPFTGDFIELYDQRVRDQPPSPRAFGVTSEKLERLILDCLRKDPALRPPNVRAVRDRLRQAIAQVQARGDGNVATGGSSQPLASAEAPTPLAAPSQLIPATLDDVAPPLSPSLLSVVRPGRGRFVGAALVVLLLGTGVGLGVWRLRGSSGVAPTPLTMAPSSTNGVVAASPAPAPEVRVPLEEIQPAASGKKNEPEKPGTARAPKRSAVTARPAETPRPPAVKVPAASEGPDEAGPPGFYKFRKSTAIGAK